MNKKILIVSVYPEFTKICEQICEENNIETIIIEAVMEDALKKIDELIRKHESPPRVIISRGATSELIQEKYKEITVLRAEPDGLDILTSYVESTTHEKKVGFLVYPQDEIEEEINTIRQIKNLVESKTYNFVSKQNIDQNIATAKEDGIEVLIGGGLYSTQLEQEHSLSVVFVRSGKKTIKKTIESGMEIIKRSSTNNIAIPKSVEDIGAKFHFDNIITQDPAMKELISNSKKYSLTDENILISGETGTGKELFAHSIHNYSKRSQERFIAINCSAIPETLIESELFGYEEGAFTGAKKDGKQGLFELADGGTLFLDEINSLPMHLQTKILRAIEYKEIFKIGSNKRISVDVRLITSTNQDLKEEIKKKSFRVDLYYRIATFEINIPALRNRREDIPLLANFFIDLHSKVYKKEIQALSYRQNEILLHYRWIGNVRELENTIKRYIVLSDQENKGQCALIDCLNLNHSMEETLNESNDIGTINIKKDTLENMEMEIILKALHENSWKKTLVAEKLGISRVSLWRKLKEDQ